MARQPIFGEISSRFIGFAAKEKLEIVLFAISNL